MRRSFVAGLLVPLALAALAGRALAKGEHMTVKGTVVITGPGLSRPISSRGVIHGYLFSEQTSAARFATLLRESGLVGFTESVHTKGYYTVLTDDSGLGPSYRVEFRLSLPDTTGPIVEVLYPYAMGGPVLRAEPGQRIEGAKVPSAWYVAGPALLPLLFDIGLPRVAPPTPHVAPSAALEPSTAPALAAPAEVRASRPLGSRSVWPWAIAVCGLASLLLAGTLLGRRRIPTVA